MRIFFTRVPCLGSLVARFDLQVLNQGSCVAISQLIAISIDHLVLLLLLEPQLDSIHRSLLWADQERSIFVDIL